MARAGALGSAGVAAGYGGGRGEEERNLERLPPLKRVKIYRSGVRTGPHVIVGQKLLDKNNCLLAFVHFCTEVQKACAQEL